MIDRIGERFEGTVSAFVGSGCFVTLDEPFVDVLVKTEDLGPDWSIDDDGLSASSARSGDALRLGERILVDIIDVALLRRQIQARRVRGEGEPARGDRRSSPFADRGSRGDARGRGRAAASREEPRRGPPGKTKKASASSSRTAGGKAGPLRTGKPGAKDRSGPKAGKAGGPDRDSRKKGGKKRR
jgi:ribonuclease R